VNSATLRDTYKHKGLRNKLVNTIISKGIKSEAVIEAVRKVPRHYFFDEAFLEHAYKDKAFPIGEGQTISQPYTVAFQTELLEIKKGDKVLEIGTGSGYQACILAELGASVYSIEYNKNLYKIASKFLPDMGYHPRLFHGDGTKGLPAFAPFNKIIVTAGAPSIPQKLIDQLSIGGILVIPVGDNEVQSMMQIRKISDTEVQKKSHNYFCFVPLIGKYGWKK